MFGIHNFYGEACNLVKYYLAAKQILRNEYNGNLAVAMYVSLYVLNQKEINNGSITPKELADSCLQILEAKDEVEYVTNVIVFFETRKIIPYVGRNDAKARKYIIKVLDGIQGGFDPRITSGMAIPIVSSILDNSHKMYGLEENMNYIDRSIYIKF